MISPLLDQILQAAVANGASDIILRSGKPAVLRINGELAAVESELPGEQDLADLWSACGAEGSELDRDGTVAEAVAMENADNPQEFARSLRGISSSMQATRR